MKTIYLILQPNFEYNDEGYDIYGYSYGDLIAYEKKQEAEDAALETNINFVAGWDVIEYFKSSLDDFLNFINLKYNLNYSLYDDIAKNPMTREDAIEFLNTRKGSQYAVAKVQEVTLK